MRLTAPRNKAAPPAGQTKVATLQICQDDRLPMSGAVVTRQYKGQTIGVRVLPDSFEYEGEIYKSLSAVAKAVTGTH